MTDRSEVSREDHETQCTGCEIWYPNGEGKIDDLEQDWCLDCWGIYTELDPKEGDDDDDDDA